MISYEWRVWSCIFSFDFIRVEGLEHETKKADVAYQRCTLFLGRVEQCELKLAESNKEEENQLQLKADLEEKQEDYRISENEERAQKDRLVTLSAQIEQVHYFYFDFDLMIFIID